MRAILLALICFSLIFATASAQDIVVPGDADGNMIVSDEELELAERSYGEERITSDELEEIRHINEKYPITIADSAGRTLIIYKPVERIIPMVTWSYEPIWILGGQEKVVGVTTNAHDDEYPWLPGMDDKPIVGTYKELDYEKVTEIDPQIVIVGSKVLAANRVDEDTLALSGIDILVLDFNNQEGFDTEFQTLANILDVEGAADEFISWKNNYLNWIKEETESIDPKVRVYGEWSYSPWLTSSKGISGIDSLIKTAGGNNIASDIPTSGAVSAITVDPEWVLEEDPEVIFVSAYGNYTGYMIESDDRTKQFLEETMNRTGLKETDAAKNGRVYVIDGKLVETVRGFIGACYCAKWFYPVEFEDLDLDHIEEIHKEYFEEWLGVPYQGVWRYSISES